MVTLRFSQATGSNPQQVVKSTHGQLSSQPRSGRNVFLHREGDNVTVNLRNRKHTLLVDHIDAFRRIVRDVKAELPFTIDAMAVLPDHWHAMWTIPPDDFGYARWIRLIKARFTRHLLSEGIVIDKDDRGEYKLWQRRFWEHTIRDDRDFESHVNYVHINPVKHGYVARATDWPHSTIHRYVERGLLVADWACAPEEGDFGE